MSAAEKLEELERTLYRPLPHPHEGERKLLAVLPEIIAVVKAAEAVSEKERTGTLPDFMPMAVALSALDEALPQIGSTSPPEGATSP